MNVTVLHRAETDNCYIHAVQRLGRFLRQGDHLSVTGFTNTDPLNNPHSQGMEANLWQADVAMLDESSLRTATGRLAIGLANDIDIPVLAFRDGSKFWWYQHSPTEWQLANYYKPDRGRK